MEQELLKDSVQGCLFGVSHKFFRYNFDRVSKLDIHPGQIPLLHLLGTQEGLSQKEIARKLGIKPPTVNVSIQRMEKGGYVYRQTDLKDQRVTRIYLTDKGKEIEEKIVAMMAESEEIIIRGFSESEICLVKRMLRHMADNLDQAFQNDKDEGR